MQTTLILRSSRLYLRMLSETDATATYAGWLNDPEVNRFLATKHATIPELQEYIRIKNSKDDTLLFGIFLNEGDKHIGTIKLEPIEPTQKRATIAIMIGDKDHWGKGLAMEAMQLLMDYSFKELGVREMHLGVIGQNTSAIKVYKKLGFIEVQRKLHSVQYGNEVFDQVEMILRP